MPRPNVTISLGNGQLGRQAASQDGVAVLVVGIPDAYLALLGIARLFYSRKDAEAAGITEANDAGQNALVWEHIKDFYSEAADGQPLHLVLVPAGTTLTNLFTVGNAANTTLAAYLQAQAGSIRLVGTALNPAAAETAGGTGITADLLTAIPLAQTFAVAEFGRYRPITVVLEGRLFTGTATNARDLRTLTSNRIGVAIGRDKVRAAALVAGRTDTLGNVLAAITLASKYAAVGQALGRLAAIPVQRSMGRVKDGPLAGVVAAELSGGTLVSSLAGTDLDLLDAKGYIYPTIHPGKDGFFYNEDPACVASTDDYAYLKDGRVIDKVARVARAVYLEELLDDVRVDPITGKLSPIEVARFQNVLENAVNTQLTAQGEISGATVYVDPAQNVIATSQISAVVSVVPVGTARQITVKVQFSNPAK